MDKSVKEELKVHAANVRLGIMEEVFNAQSGHPGGSLSIADILTYLYFVELNVDPKDPKKADRDRFVLSKGHTSPALYATLAEKGFFPKSDLKTFRKYGSYLQGHPDMKTIPGVDMSSGSLGLGISSACGMALSAKHNHNDYRVYAIIGDGESEEGQVWEAAMFAGHYKLDNLCVILDVNGLQIDGPTAEVVGPEPFDTKFEAFGWNVIKIEAHDFDMIEDAFNKAKACKGKPSIILAKSTKGKGVSYMENKVEWHGAAPKTEELYNRAVEDIKATLN